MDVSDSAGGHPSILLEPASPYPVFATNPASSSRSHHTGSGTPTYTAGSTPHASSTRSTLTPGGYFTGRSIKGVTPNRSAMFLYPRFAVSPLNSGRLSTSSVSISSGGHRFSTTSFSCLTEVGGRGGWRCPGERNRGREEECDGRRIGEEDGVSWGFGYG